MEVFHYCAAQLVGKDLFESCTNESLAALYKESTYTVSTEKVYANEDFSTFEISSQRSVTEAATDGTATQVEVEEYFLRADNDDPDRYVSGTVLLR